MQLAPRHPPIGLEIALAGRLHHARRQRRRRGVAVPAAGAALGVEIVAQRLLVEARLRLAGLVDVRRPEPRAVGRHHLVDQDDAAVAVAAELELGVGDDDALVAADLFAERIDRARHALERRAATSSPRISRIARDRDVLVVAGLGLGRRAEDRGLELCALDAGRLAASRRPACRDAAYSFQAEPEMIAADHAFDREHGGAPAQHRAPGDVGAMVLQRGHLAR